MTKYQIFTKLPQISHIHKNRNFLEYICNFLDQLFHPYKFYGRDMSGILFFIFANCEPLSHTLHSVSFSTEPIWNKNNKICSLNYRSMLNNNQMHSILHSIAYNKTTILSTLRSSFDRICQHKLEGTFNQFRHTWQIKNT